VSDATFDRIFLQDQVTMHASVLNLLDNLLIPNAQAIEIQQELTSERAAVAMHLSMAQSLLAGGTGAGGAGGSGNGGASGSP